MEPPFSSLPVFLAIGGACKWSGRRWIGLCLCALVHNSGWVTVANKYNILLVKIVPIIVEQAEHLLLLQRAHLVAESFVVIAVLPVFSGFSSH